MGLLCPAAVSPPQAKCARDGCANPSWNGQPNEYCSLGCRGASTSAKETSAQGTSAQGTSAQGTSAQGTSAQGTSICMRPGCGKPTFNGRPNEYCGKKCSLQCKFQKVDTAKFAEIAKQFNDKWKDSSSRPTIKSIWNVEDQKLMMKHNDYCRQIGNVKVKGYGKNPGNQQRRFHATKLECDFNGTPCTNDNCLVCSAIKTGFQSSKAGLSKFGKGIYCSSTSSKAYMYGPKAMFVVKVACGIYDKSDSASRLSDGTHSRIVNNSDDECVVFDNAAMVPTYLILFT